MNDLLVYINTINPISFLIIITLCNALFKLKKKITINKKLLILILSVSTLSEFLTVIFIVLNFNICFIYNTYFIINGLSWLLIITNEMKFRKVKSILILLFLLFSLSNILFIERLNLNFYTFIIGALLYVSIFIYESYKQLNRENLNYFKTNNFILLIAPILFFLGMSIVFGFRNSGIKDVIIFNKIELYTLITFTVNIIYYTLINLFIFKERKLQNA